MVEFTSTASNIVCPISLILGSIGPYLDTYNKLYFLIGDSKLKIKIDVIYGEKVDQNKNIHTIAVSDFVPALASVDGTIIEDQLLLVFKAWLIQEQI